MDIEQLKKATAHLEVNIASICMLSTVDWAGFVTPVLFLQGCNMRCPWCYNKALWDWKKGDIPLPLAIDQLAESLRTWGRLTISGGEPFMQHGQLLPLLEALKEQSIQAKVFTNGTFYSELQYAVEHKLLNSIGMDLKERNLYTNNQWANVTQSLTLLPKIDSTVNITRTKNMTDAKLEELCRLATVQTRIQMEVES